MTTTDERATDTLADTLLGNIGYLRTELDAGRWTGLRFLRFRPERELRDTLLAAERIARSRAEQDDDVINVEDEVAKDPVVEALRDAIRIHAPASQVAGCPQGYSQPPYPLTTDDRNALYDETARVLQQQMPRLLPGGADGWSWRVEPQVASDESALLIRLTPRNERFEDPIVHRQTVEQQSDDSAT